MSYDRNFEIYIGDLNSDDRLLLFKLLFSIRPNNDKEFPDNIVADKKAAEKNPSHYVHDPKSGLFFNIHEARKQMGAMINTFQGFPIGMNFSSDKIKPWFYDNYRHFGAALDIVNTIRASRGLPSTPGPNNSVPQFWIEVNPGVKHYVYTNDDM